MKASQRLLVKKSVNPANFNKGGLEKTLSAFSLTMMGVGAIVGSGIFITPELSPLSMPVRLPCSHL